MKVLFLSLCGSSLPIAQRVMREGHRSLLFIERPEARRVGDGMVEKPAFRGYLLDGRGRCDRGQLKVLLGEVGPDLVVIDGEGFGEAGDFCRQRHLPTFGGGRWADLAEREVDYGEKLLKSAGFSPASEMNGHSQEGVRVGVEVWWNGLEALTTYWSITDHHFMSGDIGPDIGCAGTVISPLHPTSRLARSSIEKIEKVLKRTPYQGVVSLELLLSPTSLYARSLVPRMVFDTAQAFLELSRTKVTDLLWRVANGESQKAETYVGYALSVRLSIPPFPYAILYPYLIPIEGVGKENERHVWLSDVKGTEKGYESAGFDGLLLAVTARGSSVREARRRAYRTISFLKVPNVQYRLDIGERTRQREVYDEWAQRVVRTPGEESLLRKWGWI